MNVLLSIKPEYVERIFSGSKKYEYRKAIFKKQNIKKVIVYSTMPVGKIVGEFEIERIIEDSPNNIWEQTQEYSGVDKSFFDYYFNDRDKGYAIKISKVKLYDKPIDPKLKYEKFTAPQSFKYLAA
ncbi:MAG: hypothetical protein COB02_12320 [Candidatus Cloacimonadota bacterium]|nr:MAG: hypothetical protein COB02_12320 [Candidatus Cloacimonadota bacterium]